MVRSLALKVSPNKRAPRRLRAVRAPRRPRLLHGGTMAASPRTGRQELRRSSTVGRASNPTEAREPIDSVLQGSSQEPSLPPRAARAEYGRPAAEAHHG